MMRRSGRGWQRHQLQFVACIRPIVPSLLCEGEIYAAKQKQSRRFATTRLHQRYLANRRYENRLRAADTAGAWGNRYRMLL